MGREATATPRLGEAKKTLLLLLVLLLYVAVQQAAAGPRSNNHMRPPRSFLPHIRVRPCVVRDHESHGMPALHTPTLITRINRPKPIDRRLTTHIYPKSHAPVCIYIGRAGARGAGQHQRHHIDGPASPHHGACRSPTHCGAAGKDLGFDWEGKGGRVGGGSWITDRSPLM